MADTCTFKGECWFRDKFGCSLPACPDDRLERLHDIPVLPQKVNPEPYLTLLDLPFVFMEKEEDYVT